jgi:hypothetical protein
MPHVLPPQPSGALAALGARDGADVVFVAHTGLGLAAYPRQFWRDMPLYDWWKRLDEWIDSR